MSTCEAGVRHGGAQRDLQDLHETIAWEMSIVARRLRARFDEGLRDLGVTYAQWTVLYWLRQAEDGLSQAELAARVAVEPGALVRIIDSLEARELVVRAPVLADRRIKQLRLTQTAIPIVERLDATIRALRADAFSQVDAATLEAALRLLTSVRVRLNA